MSQSPFASKPVSEWSVITQKLVDDHPVDLLELRTITIRTWKNLWKTKVGSGKTSVPLSEVNVPATVVGYFLEVLLSKELHLKYPGVWRGGNSKTEKDLVYIPDQSLSIEVKSSGQHGFKIFGNRSYRQESTNKHLVKKSKLGYYLTVNFVEQTLTLLRFGWIDEDDWEPQLSPTGQMAGLKQTVYDHKLIPIKGAYRRDSPIFVLQGVGEKRAQKLREKKIFTIGDLLRLQNSHPKWVTKILEDNQEFLEGCTD